MFNICCTCLKDITKSQAIYLNKTEDAVKQMKYVLPEITLDPKIPAYMCSTCQTELHSVYVFKKQCLENYGRFTKILQESGNAKNQSFSILQNDIENIKEENQIYVDLTNEASKDVNDQIHFITVQGVAEKEDITPVQDETFSTSLKKNINEDSDLTDEIKSSECEEEHNQTNIFIEDNICIEEDIIKFEASEELNLYQELLTDIKKENNSEQDIIANKTTDSNFDFECSICKIKFSQKGSFNVHMKTHTGLKDFECSICEKKFSQKGHLDRHMKTHTGLKDFECSICEKKFSQKGSLNMHMKTHTGVKNFECSICERKFIQKCHLDMHMKTHTGLKDFECSICEKKFSQKGSFYVHMKTHTGVKNFECSICKKKFMRKSPLDLHMKTHRCEGFRM